MKARLGGRVRVIVSGASPLAPAMEEFLRVAMCAPMVQVRDLGHHVGHVLDATGDGHKLKTQCVTFSQLVKSV